MIFSGMTIELDGKVIYTSDSAIAYSQDIPVEFSGTEVGKKFEIIGVTGQLLGFKDSFKIIPMSENVFYAYLHSVYQSRILGGSKIENR